MNRSISVTLSLCLLGVSSLHAAPSLTIYNQNFAVVRDQVPLDLKAGLNEIRYSEATAHVETDSVILRDPAQKFDFQIQEQNYRNDPVNQELLLSLFEGKTIDFQTDRNDDSNKAWTLVPGRIIRSGFVPGGGSEQPIIEVNNKLQFTLPGLPLFPSLGDDTILKPAFNWRIQSSRAGHVDAEIGYITGGFSWEAAYNLVAPEKGDMVDCSGWITMNNHSGTTFRDARIKLMAGDVNKIQPAQRREVMFAMKANAPEPMDRSVTEKSFDEFHLYSLAQPTTLRDHETKQVEFVHATGIHAPVIYVYNGASGFGFYGGRYEDPSFGREGNHKILVTREIVNSESNHLGMALPKGKLRFYRRNDDGQLEFTGEDQIDHTPRNETIHVTTGTAFDLTGERHQTDFHVETGSKWMEETFKIQLRNPKKEDVTIRVVEPLYRWNNWQITQKSDEFKKKDSQTIEFLVTVKPDQEKVITYKVHYSW